LIIANHPWDSAGRGIPTHLYLPASLTAPRIADQLPVLPNTVRTHMRILYATPGALLPAAVRGPVQDSQDRPGLR
jgi:hypothetical protein